MPSTADESQGVPAHPPKRTVQAVARALTMLEELADSDTPLGATQMAARAGVNRATAWRLLNTLEQFHHVERDARTGLYHLGFGPSRLAQASAAPALIRRARPILEQLGAELGESVYLQVPAGGELVVLDEVPASKPVRVHLPRTAMPLHCGSVGKLYLGFLPEDEREAVLASPLEAITEHTITDPALLRGVVDKARADRFAWAYKEHLLDWGGATAVACDSRGTPIAYINVSVPAYRYTAAGLKALRAPLLTAAARLEARLRPEPPAEIDPGASG